MDGGDRWRVIPCAAGVADRDNSIINRSVLRFRPIAPKPVDGGSSSGGWTAEKHNGAVSNGRTKRKYVRVKRSSQCRKRGKKAISSSSSDPTVQIIPRESEADRRVSVNKASENIGGFGGTDQVVVMETWVMLESVADTCMDAVSGDLGSTDEERMRNLENDTCPCFVSDGLNRVQWINEAYKEMVRNKENNERLSPEEMIISVRLVIKEEIWRYVCNGSSFACWVRLMLGTRLKEKSGSQMVPCDVWRMDFGGFAWRLDVKVALRLGL